MNPIAPLPRVLPPLFSRRYALFISHAWPYAEEYERLVGLLNADDSFDWKDLSVPEDNRLSVFAQLPRSYRYLVHQLDERIQKADCLIVLAGMYAAHSGWIQSEIEAAKDFDKPIIGVAPQGNERSPVAVTHAADEMVRWNGASIISAIRKHADGPPPLGIARVLPPPRRLGE